MSFINSLAQESSPNQSGQPQHRRATVTTATVLSLYQTKAATGRQLRRGRRDDADVRALIHHMGNSLQVILGELDLLHLTGALPQRSFDNLTQDVERLHDLMGELAGLSDPESFMFASTQRASRKSLER